MTTQTNRETWLNAAADRLNALVFSDQPLTDYRITCGFPSARGLSGKNRTIGQCWDTSCSGDSTTEIIISMTQDNPIDVIAILAHEMVHGIVGIPAGHGPAFRKLATAIGLEGKMTATVPGEQFSVMAAGIVREIGEYPHAKLDAAQRKKQSTRMIKAECAECGYTVRLSRKWADLAAPICPIDNIDMEMS